MADEQQPNKRLKTGNGIFPNNTNVENPRNGDPQLTPQKLLKVQKKLPARKIRLHVEPTLKLPPKAAFNLDTVIKKFDSPPQKGKSKAVVGTEEAHDNGSGAIPEEINRDTFNLEMENKKILGQKKKSRAVAPSEETPRENEVPPVEKQPVVAKVEIKRNLAQKKKSKAVVIIEEPHRESVSVEVPPEINHETIDLKLETKRNLLQKKKSKVAAAKEVSREYEVEGTEAETNKRRDTIVFQTETTKPTGPGLGKSKFKIKGTKTKPLVPTEETTSFLQNDEKDTSKERKSLPQNPELQINIKTEKNGTNLKRKVESKMPQSVLRKPKSLPDLPLSRRSSLSRKSVKIVLEESVDGMGNPSQDVSAPEKGGKLQKTKSKKSVTQQKTRKRPNANEDGILRPKVATLRLGVRRVSIGERDTNIEDPLEESYIRRASTYQEWAKQAKISLPSKGGVELDDAGVALTSDLLHVQVATKALKLNPNERMKRIKRELVQHRKSTLYQGDLRQRKSSSLKGGTYFDLMHPLRTSVSVEPIDEENPEDSSAEEDADDQRQKLLEAKVAEVSTAQKIAELRNIGAHLSRKRSFKKKILEEAQMKGTARTNNDLRKDTVKSIFQFYWQKIKSFFHDLHHTIDELVWWKNDLKMIESTYGSETFVYFRWIRTIIFLNMMYMLVAFSLLVLPELIINGHGDFHRAMAELRVSDLFTGEGSFTHRFSKLYYNGFAPTPHQRYFHSTPFRFCLCLVLNFIINSIYIGYQVSYFYHSTRLESEIPGASLPNSIMELVCAWDHSISNITAAKLRHQVIARDFRVMLSECRKAKMEEDDGKSNLPHKRTLEERIIEHFGETVGRWVIFWCINVFSFTLSFLNSVILFYLHDWRYYKTVESKLIAQGTLKKGESLEDKDIDPNFFIFIIPSVYTLISAQMYILYQLYFLQFEGWKSLENKLFALLSRVGFFWICEISVMYIARMVHFADMRKHQICWEVTFGSEFYRLVVLQEVINFIFTLILDGYPARRHSRNEEYPLPVFDVNRHTLNIIYIHTLSGMAFVYCPMLSFVVVVRLIITYYHERNVLENWTRCNEKETNFRMSQIYVPYLTAVFISYIISSTLNVFLIFTLNSSGYCGPFKGNSYTYSLKEAFGEVSLFFIEVIGHPGVNVSLISLLIAAMFMMKAWGHAYHCKMITLHDLLDLEKKDRDFLMGAIFNIGRASGQAGVSAAAEDDTPLPDADDSEVSANSKWTNALRALIHDTHSTKRTAPSTKKSKKRGKSAAKDLGTSESILNVRTRRKSQAEALYLASADLALPHHAMHAHRAIDDILDAKLMKGQKHLTHAQRFASMYDLKQPVTANGKSGQHRSIYDLKQPYGKSGHHRSIYNTSLLDGQRPQHATMSRSSSIKKPKSPKKLKKPDEKPPKTE